MDSPAGPVTGAANTLAQAGVLGAVLLIIFVFMWAFFFKYYLPGVQANQLKQAEAEKENQAQRDKYNQQQVTQLLDMMKDNNARFDTQNERMREDHKRAYDTQREWFRVEAEQARQHSERTVDKTCEAIASLERVVERTSVMVIALAESQGHSKTEIMQKVEKLTGERGLVDRYDTREES